MWNQAVEILKGPDFLSDIGPELNEVNIEVGNEIANIRGPWFNHKEAKICLPSKPLKEILPYYWIERVNDQLKDNNSELNICIFCILHEFGHYLEYKHHRLNYNRCVKLMIRLKEYAEQCLLTDIEFNKMYKIIDIEFKADKFAIECIFKFFQGQSIE